MSWARRPWRSCSLSLEGSCKLLPHTLVTVEVHVVPLATPVCGLPQEAQHHCRRKLRLGSREMKARLLDPAGQAASCRAGLGKGLSLFGLRSIYSSIH